MEGYVPIRTLRCLRYANVFIANLHPSFVLIFIYCRHKSGVNPANQQKRYRQRQELFSVALSSTYTTSTDGSNNSCFCFFFASEMRHAQFCTGFKTPLSQLLLGLPITFRSVYIYVISWCSAWLAYTAAIFQCESCVFEEHSLSLPLGSLAEEFRNGVTPRSVTPPITTVEFLRVVYFTMLPDLRLANN
jgi:hypothetical protein